MQAIALMVRFASAMAFDEFVRAIKRALKNLLELVADVALPDRSWLAQAHQSCGRGDLKGYL